MRNRSRRLYANALLQTLEPRVLLHGSISADGSPDICTSDPIFLDAASTPTQSPTIAGASIAISALPKYHSNPSAAAKIFLDFDGSAAFTWGGYSAPAQLTYSQDADRTTFNDAEQSQIYETWARIAEKYSPFNIDVTTEDTGNRTANSTLTLIMASDNGTWLGGTYGGVAYIDSFNSGYAQSVAWVFPTNLGPFHPKYMAEAAAHEAGHALGLQHISTYSGTTKTAEYDPGTGTGAGSISPIMGSSYYADRGLWWNGANSISSTTIQNDLAVLTTHNSFTYRVDDFGNTVNSASPLTINGSAASAKGIIEKSTDADAFSFNTDAGSVSFTVNSAQYGAMLNLKLDLYTATGTLVTSKNAQIFGESLSATVAAGSYRLVVSSNGNYGDLGQYSVAGTIIPPTTLLNAPSNLAATVSSGQVNLTWTDNSSNESNFILQRSTDGGANFSNYVTLAANTTAYSDTAVSRGSTYVYRVYAAGAVNSDNSNTASATLAPLAPASLTATAISTSQINLAWTDVAGETSYRIERSVAGGAYATLVTLAANVTSYSNTGLNPNTLYAYRIVAINAGGSATSSVASATTLNLPVPNAPTNLVATTQKQTKIRLTWSDNSSNESGFRIEQSTDGFTFTQIATTNANTTSYTTGRLTSGRTYWFRLRAYNATGNSAYSNTVSLAARANNLLASASQSPTISLFDTPDVKSKIKTDALAFLTSVAKSLNA